MHAGVHPASVGSVIVGIFVYYNFVQFSSSPQLVLLSLAFIILAYLLRSTEALFYSRSKDQKENSKNYFKRYALVTYISAVAWGSFFLALFPEEEQYQVYIIMIAIGVVTSAFSTLSYSRIIINGYLGIIFSPLLILLYIEGTETAITLLLLNVFLIIFLLIGINKFYHNFLQNLELVFTTQEQDKTLREHQQVLEQVVFERTQKLDENVKRLDLAFSAAKQGWFDFNLLTGELVVSDDHIGIFGPKDKADIPRTPADWAKRIHPADKKKTVKLFRKGLKIEDAVEVEYRWRTVNGDWMWLSSRTEVVEQDKDNYPTRVIGIYTDISRRKRIERQNDARSLVLEEVINGISLKSILQSIVGMVEQESTSISCDILLFDNESNKLFVAAAFKLENDYLNAINGTEVSDDAGSFGMAAFTKKRVIIDDIKACARCSAYKRFAIKSNLASCISEPILGSNQKLLGVLSIYHSASHALDSNAIKLAEFTSQLSSLAIERSQSDENMKLFASIFEEAREGIIVTDQEGNIVDVNPAFHRITGYNEQDIIGKTPNILHSGKHSPEFYDDILKTLDKQGHWQGELWSRTKSGELYAQSQTISSIADEAGEVLHYVSIFSDITHTKNQQKELELMAHYDTLTQLPNRTLFADRFAQSIVHNANSEAMLAVCFLDLDGFKLVNDTYGHSVGDQLLIEVTKRINHNIREEDMLSRQGGDEFTLLLDDIESFKQSEHILTRVHESLALPYLINGHDIHISASSGMTIYPLDNSDLDTLLRHADQAMYNAKLAGRNRYHLFNAQENKRVVKTNKKLQEIEDALANDEFCLHYQPKVNMRTGKVLGVEALIRWQNPQQGLLGPATFLPVVEGTKVEIAIGNWVINQAVIQLDLWHKQGLNTEISINVSSNHLQSPLFFTELENALEKHPKINAYNLQLEILESSALGDLKAISSIIRTCRDTIGVGIALDDFGTGYSSLTHLRNLKADTIKIDQSFVRDMLNESSDYAIIEGIIGLAKAFNREVIAEGVETIAHGVMLLSMGCEQAQGYVIAKPMPAEEFQSWVDNYAPNQEWMNSTSKRKLKTLTIVT